MDPDYELFDAVAACGSLSAAGRKLGVSPAMVSKRMARLEHRLGIRLIHRTTRRLALTLEGASFHKDIVAILAAIEVAEMRVSGVQGAIAGSLHLSAPTSFGRLYIAPYLKPFCDTHPELNLRISLSDRFVDMFTEEIDLAIRITPSVDRGFAAQRLATSRRILCAAPAYLIDKGSPSRINELRQHRLLAADGQLPWRLNGPLGPRSVEGRSHIRTDSSEVVRELTIAGVGISLRSLWDVHEDISKGRLVRVLDEYEGSLDVGIFAVYPSNTLVKRAVSELIAYLSRLYTAPVPWEGD